ncbi:MAG: hypothetical protein ACOX5F_04050 [Anaerovoracaceae bacterium]|jgi:hypothetical protein
MQDNYWMPQISPEMEAEACYRMEYPEIYYMIQPFVLSTCDQMAGYMMPTRDVLERMTDDIYHDVCAMYPDLAEYAHASDMTVNPYSVDPTIEASQFGRGRGRFRRRGVLRDIIDILLLNELFRRVRF